MLFWIYILSQRICKHHIWMELLFILWTIVTFFYFNASLKLNKLKGGMNIWKILPIYTSHIRVQDLLRIKVAIYLRGPSGLIDLNSVAHQFHPNISQIYSMSSRANNVWKKRQYMFLYFPQYVIEIDIFLCYLLIF